MKRTYETIYPTVTDVENKIKLLLVIAYFGMYTIAKNSRRNDEKKSL